MGKSSVTKIALSQRVFETTRDFKFFSTDNVPDSSYKIGHIGQSAGQIGHFLNETKFFPQKGGKWPKYQPNYVGRKWPMHQILAGNMFSESQRYFYIIIMYKRMLYMSIYEKNVSHKFFFKKLLQNWKKIHIFSKVNFFGKNWKKNFFQVWKFGKFFLQKIKLWEVLYLILRSHEKISSR